MSRDAPYPTPARPTGEQDYLPLIDMALAEDLGEDGDVTTQALDDRAATASLLAKAEGVLAGTAVFAAVFHRVDPAVDVRLLRGDGQRVRPGERVATVSGSLRSILAAERTSLNLLCHLSGIATQTRAFVDAAGGSPAILDTRKTLPGYRRLAKEAVRLGGGRNHRMGLDDMVLIKDNHVDAAGSVVEAIRRVRLRWGSRYVVEVECRTPEEAEAAAVAGADIVMLDNMDVQTIRESVRRVNGRAWTEASGTMSIAKVRKLAGSGLDGVSVGRLTHSVEALDLSLKIDPRGSP